MKVEVQKNMAGPEVVFRKGFVYEIEDSIAESLIRTGHAIAVDMPKEITVIEEIETQSINTNKIEKAVSTKKGKRK